MEKENDQEAVEIIDSIGGTAKTATLCETTKAAVSQWKKNGIPQARMMFLRLARPHLFKVRKEKKPLHD